MTGARPLEDFAAIIDADLRPDELAVQMLEFCGQLLADEDMERGAFALAMAAVCGYTSRGAQQFDSVMRRLKDNVWRLPYSVDALAALTSRIGLSARDDKW